LDAAGTPPDQTAVALSYAVEAERVARGAACVELLATLRVSRRCRAHGKRENGG
jgi:hypothetical protein